MAKMKTTSEDFPTDNQEIKKDAENFLEEKNSAVSSDLHSVVHVQTHFKNWFIDYASYVLLERSIPDVYDGLKPVQRRIFHSLYELEDGRYNKVANVVGNTMKYHPHGDASIGEAIINLGQKQLTIDTQGNWGNIYTGDSAAAPRYIEARLAKFALEVVFNPKTTEWKLSYDGRNKEPKHLPVKFPLLLAQGVEGIAVVMATTILPHNFNELIDASIAVLENRDFELFPDFPTGGSIDVRNYNDGLQGGRIRNRAKITIENDRTLVINDIPFGTNTMDLIANIAKVVETGTLKIKKIDDNTAAEVRIVLHLPPGVSPDQTIDALYAFTKCELSYSPNAVVIHNGRPTQMGVHDILRINTENTLHLQKRELEIELEELEEDWHRWSLEKIFFEQRIYKELEKDTETWDNQIANIEAAFDPWRSLFRREITREDVLKLCEKPVRKISKFDIKKAEDAINNIELNIEEIKNHLDHLVDYTIHYFKELKKKYGKDKERKSEIKSFDKIVASKVAVANQKLYVNKKEGFVGIGLKKEEDVELVGDCSDLDEMIVFGLTGAFMVSKVVNKKFFFKDIIHVSIFKRNDDRTIFNMIYTDGQNGPSYVKRFSIGGVTRDKEYDLTKGKKGSKVVYFTENPNGEAEKIKVFLRKKEKLRKLQFDFDFSSLAIKSRSSQGNILSRHAVNRIEMSEKGVSTLAAINVYFDPIVMKLNMEERGNFLGRFKEDDKIIAIYKSGYYRVTGYELTTHFDADLLIVEQYNEKKSISVVYYHKKEDKYFIKRFLPDKNDKKTAFIADDKDISVVLVSYDYLPRIEVKYLLKNSKDIQMEIVNVAEYVEIMKISARGKRVNFGNTVKSIKLIDPIPYDMPEEEDEEILDVEDNESNEETDDDGYNSIGNDIDEAVALEIFKTIEPKPVEKPIQKEIDKKKKPKPDTSNQPTLF
ncbi:MAG: DNA gyrase/topoisomerase IV subunit A [Bacteroidales bacterium]|jgi:topoisomerase-4 subunit A|nr:DNA gyrase/topoisomerase IV subunit A [Bacteroidales bacterium]